MGWRWILLAFGLSFGLFAIQSGDVLMYLALARDFVLKGNWEQVDPYLYPRTDGRLVWHHEYLSYLFFYAAWKLHGAAGLILVKVGILGAMLWCVLRAPPKDETQRPLWMLLWVLAVLAGSFRYIERSSLFSDLFTVVLATWLLAQNRIDRKLILRLSLLFLVWVQLHPGFVLGLIYLALWTVWHFCRTPGFRSRRLLWLMLPIALLSLNPSGLGGVLYPFEFSLNEAQTLRHYNFEWFSSLHPAFRFTPEVLAFWVLSFACAVLFIKERALFTLHAFFALAAFLLTLQAVRFMPWAAMVLVLCAKPVANLRTPLLRSKWLAYAVASLLIVAAARNFLWGYHSSSGQRLPQLGFDPKFFPTRTLEFLRRQPIAGKLYNSHDLGSSLIWNGITPVFHHGFVTDMDFFKNDVIGAMGSRERFLELARKYGWTMLLVDRPGGYREMHRILSPIPEWKIVAEDESSYLIYNLGN